ncbi:MAG: Na+/H+ antiporter [Solirubrobacteraceae bacterium]
MRRTELIVALVLVSALLVGLARAIGVPYALVLVLGGLGLGFLFGTSSPAVNPDVVLFIFLPPLIYAAAFRSSTQDLREHARSIGLLAIGLVLATMAGVAAVAHLMIGIGWGPSMVLGAILGATDPVAATSVLRRQGAPERSSTILEGESLVNDGTGLTVYKLAVAAVVSGHFSLVSGLADFFAVAAGGVAIGLLAGWLSAEIRRRIDEPQIEISISLLTGYLAYIPADRLGASGILATVAAGLYTGRQSSWILSPTSRLQTLAFWDVLTYLLESVLFLLIGLQLRHVVNGLPDLARPLLYGAGVLATLIAIRMIWMFVVPSVTRRLDPREDNSPRAGRAELLVLGWSGMRGGVSLAAALALPAMVGSRPFPDRPMLIFLSYVAIAGTLLLQGLTLPALIRRLGLGESEEIARTEAKARAALAHAALSHIDHVAQREGLQERAVEQLRSVYELRIKRIEVLIDGAGSDSDEAQLAGRIRALRRELIGVERECLAELRTEGEISLRSLRRIEHGLDLEESRLTA